MVEPIRIDLPICKSLVNRQLIRNAVVRRGWQLRVSDADLPDDVRLLKQALVDIEAGASEVYTGNCGTATRFLTAYLAQLVGREVVLRGNGYMNTWRPIDPLVNALRNCGADITYLARDGFTPLRIVGRELDKTHVQHVDDNISSQFLSALQLIDIPVALDKTIHSLYVTVMTPAVVRGYWLSEYDWSSTAPWYEYLLLHDTDKSFFFPGLHVYPTVQGDSIIGKLLLPFGVKTIETVQGVTISKCEELQRPPHPAPLPFDCKLFPDLYPTMYFVCASRGYVLDAKNTDRLLYKESNRLDSCDSLNVNHDHRMAMALLMADQPCDDTDCIRKSYPHFMEQYERVL